MILASVVLILGIIGARGGLQNKPLRPGSAFQSDKPCLGSTQPEQPVYVSLVGVPPRDSSIALYNLRSDPGLSENLAERKKFNSLLSAVETVFRAYLQTGPNALIRDRIYPHDTRKKEVPTIKN